MKKRGIQQASKQIEFTSSNKFSRHSFFFAIPHAFGERPKWIDKPPRTPQFRYYIGRATDAKTEKLGIELATRDAYHQVIRENFGILTRISHQSTETLKNTEYTKTFQELSKDVRIIRFTQEEKYLKKMPNNTFNVWVLFKYPREEIAKERQRLHKINFEKKKTVFSVQGSQKDKLKGTLEIVTEPEGASVYVDGEPWGRSPLRIVGQLSSGKHTLELVMTNYNRITKDIIIIPSKVESIREKLVRGLGKLKIVTVPHSANVVINGKRVGLSPTAFVELEAGISHKVEISHAETHLMTFNTELGTGEKKAQEIELDYRSSYLRANIPVGAEALLNGDPISRNELQNKKITPNLEYEIEVTKDGHLPYNQTISLKGGETKNLSVVLEKGSEGNLEKIFNPLLFPFEKAEEVASEVTNLGLNIKKLFQYFGVMFAKGTNNAGYISIYYNPILITPNGRIFGIEARGSVGEHGDKEEFENNLYGVGAEYSDKSPIVSKLFKAEVLFKYYPGAEEVYQNVMDATPKLLPITGPYGNIGIGFARVKSETLSGGFHEIRRFQTMSIPVGIGYDFPYLGVSVEHNIYFKNSKSPVKGNTVLGVKIRLAY